MSDYELSITTGSSNVTVIAGDEEPEETLYVVAPVDAPLGSCEGCGCRLQVPDYPPHGSIWLTPWWDFGGVCCVCKAHREDPKAIGSLRHWLDLTDTASDMCKGEAP
jgi:hypothetical protein